MLTGGRPIHAQPPSPAPGHPYRHNVRRYLLFAAMRGITLGVPIVLWVVFLQKQYGYTLSLVTLLDIPFWAGKFLFEIPTGVVADRFGRKLSLAVGAGLSSVVWLVFGLSGSFVVLALAQFVGAFAATFSSGADEALLFESLQAEGRQAEYAKISARAGALTTVSSMLAGLAVGWMAEYSLVLPVLLTSLFSALLLLPILSLKETAAPLPSGERAHLSYARVVRQALRALREHTILRWAVTYLVLLGCLSFYVAVFLQPFTLDLGLPVVMLGPVMVGMQLMSVGGAFAVPLAQRRLGSRVVLYGAPLLLAPCLALAGWYPGQAVLLPVMLAAFLFAVCQPLLLAAVQARITNETRATLLSIQSLVSTVFLIVTEPALGLLADHRGAQSTYLVMAGLLVACVFPLVWGGRRWLADGTI